MLIPLWVSFSLTPPADANRSINSRLTSFTPIIAHPPDAPVCCSSVVCLPGTLQSAPSAQSCPASGDVMPSDKLVHMPNEWVVMVVQQASGFEIVRIDRRAGISMGRNEVVQGVRSRPS